MRVRGWLAAAAAGGVVLLASCAEVPPQPVPLVTDAAEPVQLAGQAEQTKVEAVVAGQPSASLRSAIDAISAELGGIESSLAELDGQVAEAERTNMPADPAVRRAKRAFVRSASAVASAIAVARAFGHAAGTLADLVDPLQDVSDALNGADQYLIATLRAEGQVKRQEVALGGIQATVTSLRFQVATNEHDLRSLLAAALQMEAAGRGGTSPSPATHTGPSPAMTDIESEIHRAQVADLELRGIESRIRTVSVRLEGRRADLAQELADVQRQVATLNGNMATVEQIVGRRYGAWFAGIVDGQVPVIGGVLQVCPVDMPHAYSDDFGAPRWAGGFHLHQGNDIFAPEGTAIRAPFDGKAVEAENTLGGLAVKVYGDGGYVYNAHLSAYGKLGRVTVGTIIGYVGNTGDAIDSAPHDHFEWHPNGGDAVDPYPYLNAVCLPPAP